MFYLDEYHNIWKKYRLTPSFSDEKVTVRAWGNNYSAIDEIIPLRGKYPLKNCYEERMHNIGGIGARTLYLVAREQTALRTILDEAKKLGNAEAITGDYAPYTADRKPLAAHVINKPSDIEFKNLQQAAKLGFIPAKLQLARVLVTKNFAPQGFDFKTARTLLAESLAECEKYSAIGCKHAEADLHYAKELLSVIPPENTPTDELVKLYDKLQQEKANGADISFSDFKINIVAEMISSKNDNPDSIFQQALKLPNSQYKKKNEMIRLAAEKGSHNAIRLCLQQLFSRGHREHWYFLILAGKYKLPYNGNQTSYFNEAYMILREMRYMAPMPEYIKALSVLAPYHKEAENEYKKFSRELKFDISVSDQNSVSATAINQNGMQSIKIKAAPSQNTRYIIIKNKSEEKIRGSFFLESRSTAINNLDVFCEFEDENKRKQKTYCGNFMNMKFIPQELKITIAPRRQALDLTIKFMLY